MLLLLYIIVIGLLIYFFVHFKWCIETLRTIADSKNPGGYTKLIQIGFLIVLIIIFIAILIYYFWTPGRVDRIDVVFTVVVGWLGLVLGRFFGDTAMKNLEEKQEIKSEKSYLMMEKTKEFLKNFIKN